MCVARGCRTVHGGGGQWQSHGPLSAGAVLRRGTRADGCEGRGINHLDRAADAEHVTVGVTDVRLAQTPRLVARRVGDLEALGEAAPVYGVDVLDPDRDPHALVALLLGRTAGRLVRAAAPAALAVA